MKKKDYIAEQRKLIKHANRRIKDFFIPMIRIRLIESKRLIFEGQETHGKVSGLWECRQSPAGWCLYDGWNDPMEDFCLFCGQPNERK